MKKPNFVYVFIAVTTVTLGALASFYLPERFMFDAFTISLDRYNEKGWLGSYPFSMTFYDITGIGKLPFYLVALIQLPIVFLLIKKLGIPNRFHELNLRNLVVWAGLLLYGIYVGFPSKEFITLIYIWALSLVLMGSKSLKIKILLSFVLLIFFGWFYRQYFMLVPFIAVGMYLINFIKFKNSTINTIIAGVFIACFMSLSYGIVKGEFMSESSREALNNVRISRGDVNAATMIVSPVETDTFGGEVVGIVYGFFTVNLPLNGFKFILKPHVLIFVLWQLSLFIYLIYLYSNALKHRAMFQHELWVFHMLFAYFILQGVFEPDLGSAVKHKLGVFPLIWLAIYYDQGFIKHPRTSKKYVLKAKNE